MTENKKTGIAQVFKKVSQSFVYPRCYQEMILKSQKIKHGCYLLSKESILSTDEIFNMVLNKAQTTTMNIEQSFYFIKGMLSNDRK